MIVTKYSCALIGKQISSYRFLKLFICCISQNRAKMTITTELTEVRWTMLAISQSAKSGQRTHRPIIISLIFPRKRSEWLLSILLTSENLRRATLKFHVPFIWNSSILWNNNGWPLSFPVKAKTSKTFPIKTGARPLIQVQRSGRYSHKLGFLSHFPDRQSHIRP